MGRHDTLDDVTPPAQNELEFTLLGPGYGECSVIHLGQGNWIIVDSCVDDAGNPAALSYLSRIGVDANAAVRLIIVTHWHDDHIRGVARIVRDCPRAEFACPAAFREDEFLKLAAAYADGAMMRETGIQEMAETLAILQDRKMTVRLASENKLLLRDSGCELLALSPSDASTVSAMLHLHAPRLMQSKAALLAPTPNHLSVALLVKLRDIAILLGGDVLYFNDRDRGWLRIVDLYTQYGYPVADVVKIPHHGSAGADCNEMWSLLRDRPVAALTAFRRGAVALPTSEDVSRICDKSADAYLTSPPGPRRPKKRHSAVEKTVSDLLRDRKLPSLEFGRVTLRSTLDRRTKWTAHLAGPAFRMYPGSV